MVEGICKLGESVLRILPTYFLESVDFIRQLLKVGGIERNPLNRNGLSHHHFDGTLSA
jgi:hypothetical protein